MREVLTVLQFEFPKYYMLWPKDSGIQTDGGLVPARGIVRFDRVHTVNVYAETMENRGTKYVKGAWILNDVCSLRWRWTAIK